MPREIGRVPEHLIGERSYRTHTLTKPTPFYEITVAYLTLRKYLTQNPVSPPSAAGMSHFQLRLITDTRVRETKLLYQSTRTMKHANIYLAERSPSLPTNLLANSQRIRISRLFLSAKPDDHRYWTHEFPSEQ